jgi:cytochrome b involved in lipid metabolism
MTLSTDFIDSHPGGEGVLIEVAGKDATAEFYGLHRHVSHSKHFVTS